MVELRKMIQICSVVNYTELSSSRFSETKLVKNISFIRLIQILAISAFLKK